MTTRAIGKAPATWLAVVTLSLGGVLQAASCKEPAGGTTPDASASASASPGGLASSAGAAGRAEGASHDRDGHDAIGPVYPVDNKPPLPEAEQYCNAVRELPRTRRLECCPTSGAWAPTGECIRTLSSALRSGAVTIDKAALDACVATMTKETEGCDWVTSVASPTPPACLGIIKGTVKEGALCRSNLECDEGTRCRGLTAVRPGRCGSPLPRFGPCNTAVDSLASFSAQNDVDRHHPECTGYCARRTCQDPIPPGAACTGSFECGPKAHCIAGKCSDGPLPGPGAACTDACASGARCWKGKCVAVKGGDEACEEDIECKGRCAREDGGKTGKCAPDCPSFPIPKPKKR